MKKLFNYLIAMCFAMLPVLIFREYADKPNQFIILQTIGVALAFWVIVPVWMKWIKKHIKSASDGWYKGREASFVFAFFLVVWMFILLTNG